MAFEDSIPVLAALLQREVMLVLSDSLDRPLQGIGTGAKALQLSTTTRRRIREIGSLLGWVKKLSRPGISKFVADLKAEIKSKVVFLLLTIFPTGVYMFIPTVFTQ